MEVEQVNQMAREIATLKLRKKELEAMSVEVSKKLDPLIERFVEVLTELGKPNWFVEGVGLFSPKKSNYYKVTDYEKLRQYLRTYGLDQMLTVNSQTLRGWLNQFESLNQFQNIVEVDPRTTISFKGE